MEIIRTRELDELKVSVANAPVTAILGPRQCGKTTLAKQFVGLRLYDDVNFFDCENPIDISRLQNPMLALDDLTGLVIIDEIQLMPELFPVLRVLADAKKERRFLILGSASRNLVMRGSESLAGRVSFFELTGFTLSDINNDLEKLWIRGGFPRSFLAKSDDLSWRWRHDFIRTFLERDIPNLGIRIPANTLRKFWTMLSHYHGQILNSSELGRSMDISNKTIKRYLDILSGTFIIRQLQPWYYNTKKRLVKSPKIYFRDSGLFHFFQAIKNKNQLLNHPKLGASWEGFALEQVLTELTIKDEACFWGVHTGAELDLVFQRHGKLWGIEVKYSDAPRVTRSLRFALEELNPEHLWVVYPGKTDYAVDKKITVIGLNSLSRITQHLAACR